MFKGLVGIFQYCASVPLLFSLFFIYAPANHVSVGELVECLCQF